MDAMQYEALRRAQEMQSRIRGQGGNQKASEPNRPKAAPQSSEDNPHRNEQSPVPPLKEDNLKESIKTDTHRSNSINTQQSSPLNTLFEDKEKLLILVLILILSSEENSDPTVILALLYLII